MSSHLVLIRHGESEVNRINRERRLFCGRLDTPLTDLGRTQAVQAGKLLASVPNLQIRYAISSTLSRARDTLELMKPVLPDNCRFLTASSELSERSLGSFEGQSEEDVFVKFPAYRHDPQYNRFFNDFVQKAPGGENLQDVTDRMTRVVLALWDSIDDDWVVVTHGCAIRCLLGRLLNWSAERVIDTHIPNAIPIIVRRAGYDRFELADFPELGDD